MPKVELLNLIFKQTISVYLGLNVFGNIFMLARRQYLDKFTFLVELCVCVQHEKKISTHAIAVFGICCSIFLQFLFCRLWYFSTECVSLILCSSHNILTSWQNDIQSLRIPILLPHTKISCWNQLGKASLEEEQVPVEYPTGPVYCSRVQ